MNDLFTTNGGQIVFKKDKRSIRGPRQGDTVRERNMPNSQPIWRAYPTASDHYPVSATVTI
jgi:hypothetical protein